jgi:hypothetical protein
VIHHALRLHTSLRGVLTLRDDGRQRQGFANELAGSLLPVLSGSLSYLALSPPLHPRTSPPSVLEQTDTFHLPAPPRPPQTSEIWLGGRRADKTPFFSWGRVTLPEWKVEGVGCRRLSDRVMGLMAFVHSPPEKGKAKGRDGLVLQIQHSNGRWGGEYSYSLTDGLFGFRTLCSFGPPPDPVDMQQGEEPDLQLRGRFSIGLESYMSLKQKSAGRAYLRREGGAALRALPTHPFASQHSLARDALSYANFTRRINAAQHFDAPLLSADRPHLDLVPLVADAGARARDALRVQRVLIRVRLDPRRRVEGRHDPQGQRGR